MYKTKQNIMNQIMKSLSNSIQGFSETDVDSKC